MQCLVQVTDALRDGQATRLMHCQEHTRYTVNYHVLGSVLGPLTLLWHATVVIWISR